jgi:hypothetical protein
MSCLTVTRVDVGYVTHDKRRRRRLPDGTRRHCRTDG